MTVVFKQEVKNPMWKKILGFVNCVKMEGRCCGQMNGCHYVTRVGALKNNPYLLLHILYNVINKHIGYVTKGWELTFKSFIRPL